MHALRVARIGAAALLLLAFAGLIADGVEGFPFTRGAGTPLVWIAGLLVGGAVSIVGEMVFGGILEADQVTDPLGRRLVRLALWLAAMALVGGLVVALALRFGRSA